MGLGDNEDGFVDRLSRQGEETLGRIAEEIVASPVVSAAVARALEARETAVRAQEAAMGALGIPSAADVERLTRRLRSVSQRLEGIEDSLDRIERNAAGAAATAASSGSTALEGQIAAIAADIAAVRDSLTPEGEPRARGQERLTVSDAD
jgi:hypothetical protein